MHKDLVFTTPDMILQRAQELVNQFAGHRLLVVGDVLLDYYVHGVAERLSAEAPVPVFLAQSQDVMTGGAGNVSKNVARLGAHALLISVIGDDEAASDARAAAEHEGYDASLFTDGSRSTIRKMRYLAGHHQLLRVDYEQAHDISSQLEGYVIEALWETVRQGVDGIIVSDYAKGVITRGVAEAILDMASEHDVLVGTNVKPSRAPYFVGATFVSPNLKEGHEYIGLSHFEDQLSPADVAQRVYKRLCSDVYLTLGPDGMYVYCGGEEGVHVPQEHVVEVSDVTGASDTVAVVLMLALLSGATPAEAAELSNAGGAVVVGKVGTVGPTREELLNMVARRHE